MKKAIKIFLGLTAVLVIALTGALIAYQSEFGPPLIYIKNGTDVVLTDIRIYDSRWEHKIDRLDPGSEMEFIQHVGGESGLSVSFKANGKVFTKTDMEYFEESGGYCVGIMILPKFAIYSDSRIKCSNRKRAS